MRRLVILAVDVVHVTGLHGHELSVGRGEPDAATSLSQGRMNLRRGARKS